MYDYDNITFDGPNSFITRKFSDIFPLFDTFKEEYNNMPNTWKVLNNDYLESCYYCLYASYGNSTIASTDEQQFEFKLFNIIYKFGGFWYKNLEIQKYLRTLTEDDNGNFKVSELTSGSKVINNSANNPNTAPVNTSLEELKYISAQNTTNYKRDVLSAVSEYSLLLEKDFTTEFIDKFKELFITIVEPQRNVLYYGD